MTRPGSFDTRAATWDQNPGVIERAGAIAGLIRDRVDLDAVEHMMEYGAGTGVLSFALLPLMARPPVHAMLADSSPGMLEVARQKIDDARLTGCETRLLDLTRDPLPGERFDLIYTLMTLHHIPDVSAMLNTFAHLLRQSGHLVIVDLDAEDGSFHGPDADVHPGFDRARLARQLRQAGFCAAVETACVIRRGDRDYPLFAAIARLVDQAGPDAAG